MAERLHLEQWGRCGPRVVLIHGLGASGRYWRDVAQLLSADLRLLAPDLLGFGRSPWPQLDYRIGDHLDALDGLLELPEVGKDPLVLVGHSLGSILALAWAGRHPGRFAGLLLIGFPLYRSPEEARRHIARLGPLAYATVATPRLGAAICALMCWGRPFWRRLAPLLLPGVPPEIARDGVLHTWRSYSGTLNHCLLDFDVRAAANRLATTNLPVRLLHGSLDREAPAEAMLGLVRETGWELELVPGVGHGLPLERPRQCAEAIRALATLAEPSAGR